MSLLIPDAEVATEETTEETTEVVSTEEAKDDTPKSKVIYADGVEVEGEVPEWFKSKKFKTVSDQAKSYTELEKKLGSFTGAPEKYELDGVDFESNPLLKLTAEWGKENNLNNDGLSSLVQRVSELSLKQVEEDNANAIKELGENATKRLSDIAQWGKNNLSADEYKQFQSMPQTAGQIALVEKLIGMSKNSKIVDVKTKENTIEDAKEELRKMQLATDKDGKRLMDTDMAYRKKVLDRTKELYD